MSQNGVKGKTVVKLLPTCWLIHEFLSLQSYQIVLAWLGEHRVFFSDECMRCELRTCGWFGIYICTPIYLIRPLCVLSDANGVCMHDTFHTYAIRPSYFLLELRRNKDATGLFGVLLTVVSYRIESVS